MFRNRSPMGAGILAFLLVIAIWIVIIAGITLMLGPAMAAQLGISSSMASFVGFMESWGLFIALGAGVIAYFWKRSQRKSGAD